MGKPINMSEYLKSRTEYNEVNLMEKKSNHLVSTIKNIKLDSDDSISSCLLSIVSKSSNTHPELALHILSLCANDDIPKSKILNYTIKLLEDDQIEKN